MHVVKAVQVLQLESHKAHVFPPLLYWPAIHAPQVLELPINRSVVQDVQKVG